MKGKGCLGDLCYSWDYFPSADGSPEISRALINIALDIRQMNSRWNLLQDPQERAQAEQLLRVFGQSTEYIAHCKVCRFCGLQGVSLVALSVRDLTFPGFVQAILDNSQSSYAQLLASASLLKVVTEHTIR